jgi:hypothetical protein
MKFKNEEDVRFGLRFSLLILVKRMKPLVLAVGLALVCANAMLAASEHLLQGPYDYDEHGKPQLRFYIIGRKDVH